VENREYKKFRYTNELENSHLENLEGDWEIIFWLIFWRLILRKGG
jgi:hypothetical protein